MTTVWISLVITLFPIASAWSAGGSKISTAEYYEFESWSGEYPNGYEIYADVRVPTVTSPGNSKPGPDCTLKAKSVIHPWARKTRSEFLTQTSISKLIAKSDFTLDEEKVKKGTHFTQLNYLAEGFCRFLVNGKVAESNCVFDSDDERASLEYTSPFQTREIFKTRCADTGNEQWIASRELRLLSEEKDSPSVGYAEIIDYGTVKEP